MSRTVIKRICIWGLIALMAVGAAVIVLGYFSLSAEAISIRVFITRDGKALKSDQIRSVRFIARREYPQDPSVIPDHDLHDAMLDHESFLIGASFDRYYDHILFGKNTVEPDLHSAIIRVTLIDGSAIALSCPVNADKNQQGVIYVNFSSPLQQNK